ncbi:DegV family protein [Streptococcus gallolyticus]|uniref:DegV family protein n=1 Tax=Streptococcus hepaticus TaxID=3349163 RepID=UPI001C95521B|nr:DegV family protein [Streptococcus gallolyticus]MBY5040994.1 DegV family protein [Streptococcus gallolyticus]
MTFKLMTDSTADLSPQWLEEQGVSQLGMVLELDGIAYQTVGDDRITAPVLLEKMAAGGLPTTSQINAGQFETAFRRELEAGQPILYLAFSSGLSGTYQSALIARDMILEDYPEAVIEVFDTRAATLGQGLLVMKAVEARSQGMSLEETVNYLTELAPRVRSYVMVDDLQHLVRGGRLSKTSAMVGGLMNIKPLITVTAEGKLEAFGKVRGRKKAVKELITSSLMELAEPRVMVSYTGDWAAAEDVKTALLEHPQVEEVLIEHIGPVISTHVGTGCLAIFSIAQTNR